MSFTGNYMTTSFKAELLAAMHNFTNGTGHTFKAALYTSAATLNAGTTAYSATNEVVGTGYTAGGVALTNVTPIVNGNTALTDWADALWPSSSVTARGALIYNATSANRSVLVLDFGTDKTTLASTFSIVFPLADVVNAIIRIA